MVIPKQPNRPIRDDGSGTAAAVGIQITVDVRPESREEFLQAMDTLRPADTLPSDKSSSGLFEDRKHRNRFLIIEQWSDAHQLELRLRSDRFHAVIGAVTVLGTVLHIFTHNATRLNHVATQDEHHTTQ
jgi:quinol monooxygenase YgiN